MIFLWANTCISLKSSGLFFLLVKRVDKLADVLDEILIFALKFHEFIVLIVKFLILFQNLAILDLNVV